MCIVLKRSKRLGERKQCSVGVESEGGTRKHSDTQVNNEECEWF